MMCMSAKVSAVLRLAHAAISNNQCFVRKLHIATTPPIVRHHQQSHELTRVSSWRAGVIHPCGALASSLSNQSMLNHLDRLQSTGAARADASFERDGFVPSRVVHITCCFVFLLHFVFLFHAGSAASAGSSIFILSSFVSFMSSCSPSASEHSRRHSTRSSTTSAAPRKLLR